MYEEHLNKKYNEWTIVKFSHKDKHNHPFLNVSVLVEIKIQ